MAITKISAPNNYVLLTTTNITTAAAFVDFTSLANYSEYLVFISGATTINATRIECRINGSASAANYAGVTGLVTAFSLTSLSSIAAKNGSIVIYDALLTSPHPVMAGIVGDNSRALQHFFDGSAVTSIRIKPSGGISFNSTGIIYLFGRL